MIMDLRRSIDDALDKPLTSGEWDHVQSEITKVFPGIGPSAIAAKISQLRERMRPQSSAASTHRVTMRKDPARDARSVLLSYLISKLADNIDSVTRFRKDILGGDLVSVGEVESWIAERSESEGFTAWNDEPYAASDSQIKHDHDGTPYVEITGSATPLKNDRKARLRWLEYAVPNQPSRGIRTAANGVLERLRTVSEQLAREVGCDASEATMFVLSGVPLPSYACRKGFDFRGSDQLGALNRIRLTIDPTLSPREVANIYRQMRAQIFGKRYRAMSEKHIRLALFAFERDPHESIKTAMADWNRIYRKWRYKYESNFGRDRNTARQRAFVGTLDSPRLSRMALDSWLLGQTEQKPPAKTKGRKSR